MQKLAKIISVPTSTIEAIEDPDNNEIPLANLSGLVKRYSSEVKLDPSDIADEMAALKPLPQSKTSKVVKLPGSRIFVASRATFALIAGIVLAVVLGYAAWQAWQLAAAPRLDLYYPSDNMVTIESSVVVSGKSSPESSVLINGSNVSLAEDGSFQSEIYLQPGNNYLQVRALNAFGHEALEDRIIIYKD